MKRFRTLALAVALLPAVILPAAAAALKCPTGKLDGPPGLSQSNLSFSKIWDYATSLPGRVINQYPDVTVVEVRSQCATYAFTKPNHFAYPSVLWRYVFDTPEGVSVASRGFGFGPKGPFDKWMAGVPAMDREMQYELRHRSMR